MANFEKLAQDAHLTILLGAGASAPSGLPDWDEFACRLALRSGLVRSKTAATTLLSRQDHAFILEAAQSRSGEHWEEFLSEALYGGLAEDPEPSPLHFAAIGHYLQNRMNTTVATLNFDTLLERAIIENGEPLVSARYQKELAETVSPVVHHLHGIVSDGSAYEPIVGFCDYEELVARNDAWQRDFLSEALRSGPLFLAGTSYRDPDIRHWLHLIMRDEKPRHSALVAIVREGLGLIGRHSEFSARRWQPNGSLLDCPHCLCMILLMLRS